MKTVQKRTPAAVNANIEEIPEHEVDALCRTLIGSVARLFTNPAVKADYESWKKERQQKGGVNARK